jgi:hypothetical protein
MSLAMKDSEIDRKHSQHEYVESNPENQPFRGHRVFLWLEKLLGA